MVALTGRMSFVSFDVHGVGPSSDLLHLNFTITLSNNLTIILSIDILTLVCQSIN